MSTPTVTTETATNADAILESMYRNGVKLAQNAHGRDDVTDEEIEVGFWTLMTEALKRDDMRDILMTTIAVTAGRDAGLIDVG